MDKCWLCELHPIDMVIRPLCHSCYSSCRKFKLLHIFPLMNSSNKTILKTLSKYGNEFMGDMNLLNSGKTTLVAVGNKYGVTRERIRQLYLIFFNKKYTEAVLMKSSILKSKKINDDIEKHIFENRLNRAKKSGKMWKGIVAENLFLQKCKLLGFTVEMQRGHFLFDAMVNNIPVDIKSYTEATRYGGKLKNQLYYRFATTCKQRKAVKYFVCLLVDEGVWYILPSIKISGNMIYIPKYNIKYNGKSTYENLQKYREAWHLLKNV